MPAPVMWVHAARAKSMETSVQWIQANGAEASALVLGVFGVGQIIVGVGTTSVPSNVV